MNGIPIYEQNTNLRIWGITNMIIIMKPNASEEAIKKVKHLIESKGLQAHLSKSTPEQRQLLNKDKNVIRL